MDVTNCIMKYSSVPSESKSQINKAGNILSGRIPGDTDEFAHAIDLTSRWRACHAYPINTFQATLRNKLKKYQKPIVGQRLKRLATIIDKMKRYPNMQLATMQDIGGLRAILSTVKEVYKLSQNYEESKRFKDLIVNCKDYINNPRDEDGYRSVHLVFKYENQQVPQYNNLKIELQIRTYLQHAWATAVETMGSFLGQALKSRQGTQEWQDFFAIVSSAFAYREKCKPIPRFAHLSEAETAKIIKAMNEKLEVLDKLAGFSAAMDVINTKKHTGEYYLLVLDSLNKHVGITIYNKRDFSQALTDYSKIEVEVINGKKVEPVLVSASSVRALKKAYPNFFLDTNEFTKVLKSIIASAG